MTEVGDQVRDRGSGPVDRRRRRGRLLAVGPAVDDPPDPAARAVAARVVQVDLVMADDPVVEVGDVERAVGAQLDIHRPEPVVLAPDEVGLFDPFGTRPVPLDPVVVDSVGDDVADEDRAAIGRGELVGGVVADAADAGRAVVVGDHVGAEAQPVIRLAEAGVVGAAQQLIDRPAVAVARVQVAQRVERQPERVDLAVGDVFGVRAVGPHPVGVARLHLDRPVVLSLHLRVVGEAVAGVDPAVEAPGEGVGHAVGVAVADHAVEHVAAVGAAVAVGVLHQVDVGDIVHDGRAAGRVGQQADRDVQAVGERLDLAGTAVGPEVGEDLDGVATRRARGLRERVLERVGHPEPAQVVEGDVQRLVDVGLRSDELDLEPGRQVQRLALVLGRAVRQRRDVLDRRRGLGATRIGMAYG